MGFYTLKYIGLSVFTFYEGVCRKVMNAFGGPRHLKVSKHLSNLLLRGKVIWQPRGRRSEKPHTLITVVDIGQALKMLLRGNH